MKTTCEFLDDIKANNNGASDYAIAKMLGVTRSCVSFYRTGRSCFDDSTSIKVANLLNIDPSIVVSAVHAERAKSVQEKAVWKGIYERLGGMAAAILLGLALAAPTPDASADGMKNVCNVYYVK